MVVGRRFRARVAASVLVVIPLVPMPAEADSWGCEVLLCLATPGSPTTYAQCVPPIAKLWKSLATGHVFPSCLEGGSTAKTRKIGDGYLVELGQPDGSVKAYWLNTKAERIVPIQPDTHADDAESRHPRRVPRLMER